MSDVKVGIEFIASPGNVKAVADRAKKDIEAINQAGAGRSTLTQSLQLEPVLDTTRLKAETAKAASLLKPLEIPIHPDLTQMRTQMAAVDLTKIGGSLDKALEIPSLQGQTAAYQDVIRNLDSWRAANGQVMASNKMLQSSYSTMLESARDGIQRVAERAQSLGQIGAMVTAALAGIGSIAAGAAAGALMVSANFEQLRAKLISVTGSAEEANRKFEMAKTLAASSPYDVASMVSATATLEGFRQESEALLPVAANLASALGKDLKEATLVLSKAAVGNPEGWESLRNDYAIATRDLLRFGAAQGKVKNQLDLSEPSVERNRNALVRLINTRYGDAIERQSNTLAGALSNIGDEVQALAAGVADPFLGLATTLTRFASSAIGALNAIPNGIKAMVGASVASIAGFALVGAGMTGLAAAGLLLQGQLLALSLQLEAFPALALAASAGSNLISIGLGQMARAASLARSAMMWMLTSPVGMFALGAGAALALLTNELDRYRRKSEEAGDAVSRSSRQFSEANSTFRGAVTLLNQAGKQAGVSVDIVGKSSAQFQQLNNAFAKMSPQQIVETFSKAGESSDSLKEKLKALESGSDSIQQKLNAVSAARTAFENGDWIGFAEARENLKGFGIEIDNGGNKLEQLMGIAKSLTFDLQRVGQAKTSINGVISAFDAFAKPLEDAAKNSKQLGTLLDLSKQVGTASALADALAEVNRQIAANASTNGIDTDNLDKLLAKLRDKSISDVQRGAIEEQIKLVQQRTSIEEADQKRRDGIVSREMEQQELAFRRKKALNDTSLAEELRFVQSQLGIVRKGSEEEVALLERAQQLKKDIRGKQQDTASKSLETVTGSNQRNLDDARETGDQGAVVQAIDQNIAAVAAWRAANAPLIKQFPELAAELAKVERSQGIDRQREAAKLAKDAVKALADEFSLAFADAETNAQKLTTIEVAINQLSAARRSGLLDETAAQNQLNSLVKTKLQTEQAITREKQQQVNELRSLELQNQDQQIQILEAQKAAGQDVNKELKKAYDQRVQMALDAIEQERREKIQAGQDLATIEAQADAKRQNVLRAETLRQFQQLQDQEKQLSDSLGRREKLWTGYQSAVGGPNSPLYSDPSEGAGISFGPAFTLGNIRPMRPKGPQQYDKLRQKVESQYQWKPSQDEPSGPTTQNVQNYETVVNGFDGKSLAFKQAVLTVLREAGTSAQNRTGTA